jgi:hypothetical protein
MLGRNPDFLHPILDRKNVSQASLGLSPLAPGAYYWRVAGIDAVGREGPFAFAAQFDQTSPSGVSSIPQDHGSPRGAAAPPEASAASAPPTPPSAGVAVAVTSGSSPSPASAPVAPLPTALLQLRIKQFGVRVIIDGKLVGSTPLAPVRLPVGKHTLELVHPDYQPFERVVRVDPGKPNYFPLLIFPPFDFELEHARK